MLLKRVRKSTTFLSFRVSENVKKKYEKIVSALREKGYEIDIDETVLRVIKSIEKGVEKEGRKDREKPCGFSPGPPI